MRRPGRASKPRVLGSATLRLGAAGTTLVPWLPRPHRDRAAATRMAAVGLPRAARALAAETAAACMHCHGAAALVTSGRALGRAAPTGPRRCSASPCRSVGLAAPYADSRLDAAGPMHGAAAPHNCCRRCLGCWPCSVGRLSISAGSHYTHGSRLLLHCLGTADSPMPASPLFHAADRASRLQHSFLSRQHAGCLCRPSSLISRTLKQQCMQKLLGGMEC